MLFERLRKRIRSLPLFGLVKNNLKWNSQDLELIQFQIHLKPFNYCESITSRL